MSLWPSVDLLCTRHDGRLSPLTHAVVMRARESSGLLALFPTAPEAVARGVFGRDGGCAHQGVMAEEGAHCPAMMLHRLGASQCRTDQPSNASGSGLCKTVTGSLSRWPARCWVRVRGKAVGNAFKPRRSSPPPSGRGAEAPRAVAKAVCIAYTPSGARGPQGLTMLSMKLFGGAVNQGAVRLLPELVLGRRAGGHVQPGEVSQQEEVRPLKKVLEQGGRDGAIRDEPASVRRPPRRPVIASRRP